MIILDTSFIVSYYNTMDSNHAKAVKIMEQLKDNKWGDIFISDYIFDETATVIFSKLKDLGATVKIVADLNNFVNMSFIEAATFEGSWEIFKSQKGTKFSFTDCTTLSLMKNMGIAHIATFDEDFKRIKEISIVRE